MNSSSPSLPHGSPISVVSRRGSRYVSGMRRQGQEFVLSLEALEDFYENLSRLIEYVRIGAAAPAHV